jgi:peroxiredoxin
MITRPDTPLLETWDEIAGARGCTPQSCSFRDHYKELQQYNAKLYGLSAQSSAYQLEAKERLHLPFELLRDPKLVLKSALNFPTFEVEGLELYRRITLIIRDGVIEKIFYPVLVLSDNAEEVIKWLQLNA